MKNYNEIEVYSDVKAIGFLPKKDKYTMRDVNSLIVDSLFLDTDSTLCPTRAAFVVKCSAIYHGTNYSKAVGNVNVLNDIVS